MSNEIILLGKGLDKDGNVLEVSGTSFYRAGSTGLVDGIEAVQQAGLIQIPIYLLGEGRVAAGRDAQAQGNIQLALQEPVWTQFHDGLAEVDTVVDKKGILGKKGQEYVAKFQNSGLFVNDHQRIKDAVLGRNGKRLTDSYAMPLDQQEVNAFLDTVKSRDANALQQMGFLQGGSVYVFKNFGEFADASARADFLADMPGYVVVRSAGEAQLQGSGNKDISTQRRNQDLAIDFGGVARVGAVLDVAEQLGWTQFGAHNDGYSSGNSGRVVYLGYHDVGVSGNGGISDNGRPVGVTPEVLETRAKIVTSLPLEVTVAKEAVGNDDKLVHVNDVRRLLGEYLGYTTERVEQHLGILAQYKEQ